MVAWVAKEWDNTVEIAFGGFFALRFSPNLIEFKKPSENRDF